jgi:hypothetical protein
MGKTESVDWFLRKMAFSFWFRPAAAKPQEDFHPAKLLYFIIKFIHKVGLILNQTKPENSSLDRKRRLRLLLLTLQLRIIES